MVWCLGHYLVRKGCSGFGRTRGTELPVHWFPVRENEKGKGVINMTHTVNFPPEYIGKRIRLKVELEPFPEPPLNANKRTEAKEKWLRQGKTHTQ